MKDIPNKDKMLYATYIFPHEKKTKEKKVEVVETGQKKETQLVKRFGSAPAESDLSSAERLLRDAAHLTELHHKIQHLEESNENLQNYLDERPDLHFDTQKVCCLLQNEDLYNWTRIYQQLVADVAKMPEVLSEKQATLDKLKEEYNRLMTEYDKLEEREELTKQLKIKATICNVELGEKSKKIKDMQERLTWMEDYHKIQINGEVGKIRKDQFKQKFAVNHFKKLCEPLLELQSKKSSSQIIKKISSVALPKQLKCQNL